MNARKSVSGMPLPGVASGHVVMSAEARVARRRLWRSTSVYGTASATVLLFAAHRHGPIACLPWIAAGGDRKSVV